VLNVSDTEIVCDHQIVDVIRTLTFSRQSVREVRLEEPKRNYWIAGTVVGTVIGGLAGFALSARSNDKETRAYTRIFGFPIGGVVGAQIGHHLHSHGPVIYRRQ
jgi:uncharacterized protein YcfJ